MALERCRPRRGEAGTGTFGLAAGFVVFLLLLFLAVQLLFGLYARTTVTAVASDTVRRAANSGTTSPAALGVFAADGRARLGEYADDVEFSLRVVDDDGRPGPDSVELVVDAKLPTFLPAPLSAGGGRFSAVHRARIEQFQGSGR